MAGFAADIISMVYNMVRRGRRNAYHRRLAFVQRRHQAYIYRSERKLLVLLKIVALRHLFYIVNTQEARNAHIRVSLPVFLVMFNEVRHTQQLVPLAINQYVYQQDQYAEKLLQPC